MDFIYKNLHFFRTFQNTQLFGLTPRKTNLTFSVVNDELSANSGNDSKVGKQERAGSSTPASSDLIMERGSPPPSSEYSSSYTIANLSLVYPVPEISLYNPSLVYPT